MRFLGDGLLPRVGLRDSWAMDPSRAWKFVIPERWTIPARGIARFLGDGPFPRVGLRDSWAVDYSCAWNCTIPGDGPLPLRNYEFPRAGGVHRPGIAQFHAQRSEERRVGKEETSGRWSRSINNILTRMYDN